MASNGDFSLARIAEAGFAPQPWAWLNQSAILLNRAKALPAKPRIKARIKAKVPGTIGHSF
jgi:hypothetical protein